MASNRVQYARVILNREACSRIRTHDFAMTYTRRAVKWHKLLLRQMRTSRQDRSESGDADEGRLLNRPEWSCRDARMRRFIFTEEVQQALAKDRYHHPDPRVQEQRENIRG